MLSVGSTTSSRMVDDLWDNKNVSCSILLSFRTVKSRNVAKIINCPVFMQTPLAASATNLIESLPVTILRR